MQQTKLQFVIKRNQQENSNSLHSQSNGDSECLSEQPKYPLGYAFISTSFVGVGSQETGSNNQSPSEKVAKEKQDIPDLNDRIEYSMFNRVRKAL